MAPSFFVSSAIVELFGQVCDFYFSGSIQFITGVASPSEKRLHPARMMGMKKVEVTARAHSQEDHQAMSANGESATVESFRAKAAFMKAWRPENTPSVSLDIEMEF